MQYPSSHKVLPKQKDRTLPATKTMKIVVKDLPYIYNLANIFMKIS